MNIYVEAYGYYAPSNKTLQQNNWRVECKRSHSKRISFQRDICPKSGMLIWEKKRKPNLSNWDLLKILTHDNIKMAVRVRTNKANFGPAPIFLSFSLEVNNSIPCTNITFILINFIFFIFYETILKVTKNCSICLLWPL